MAILNSFRSLLFALSVHCPTENAVPGRTDLAGPPHPRSLEIEATEEVAPEPALDRPPIWQ
jgi:hypothetical protein